MFVGGEFIRTGRERFPVVNPATEEVLADVAYALVDPRVKAKYAA